MLRNVKVVAFALLLWTTPANGMEPACASLAECADDDAGQQVDLLQRAAVLSDEAGLESSSAPVTNPAPAGAGKPADVVARGRPGHRGGFRAHRRAADPASLREAAHSAGMSWTFDEAVERAAGSNRTLLSLLTGELAPSPTPPPKFNDNLIVGYRSDGSLGAWRTRMSDFAADCRGINTVGYSGCGGSIANLFSSTSKLFFSSDDLTLQDAYHITSDITIEALNNIFPLVGLAATMASAFISEALFPGDDEDPYIAAMQEMADLVLEKATRVATNNLLSSTVMAHASELKAISEDLEFLPQLLVDTDTNPDAELVLFNYNLVMLHEISKLGGLIKEGALANIANEQWSYEIFAIATQVVQLEVVLILQLANHSLVEKKVMNHRLQEKMFGSGGWVEWFQEHWPKALNYINDEFDKCDMDPSAKNHPEVHVSGINGNKYTDTCRVTQDDTDCTRVLGSMNLFETMATCQHMDQKELCKDNNVYASQRECKRRCESCDRDPTQCTTASDVCTNSDRDAARNKLLNSFEDLKLQWLGCFGAAGGYGQLAKSYFTEHRGVDVCAGSDCNPITEVGQKTFSECWEQCFSTTGCAAIEVPKCNEHSKTVTGLETGLDGKFLNLDWKSWMGSKDVEHHSVRQCRGGMQIWMGPATCFHNDGLHGQTKGDAHCRRRPDSVGDWEVGDQIMPEGLYCGQDECGKGCADHSSMLGVQGVSSNGKYFFIDWKEWMTNNGTSSGTGRMLDIRQCRDGGEVWAGAMTVWNKVMDDQAVGNSVGRRSVGAKGSQWQAGDKIYPWIYPCDAQECACNLVTGLGDSPMTFRSMAPWSVFTTKVH